MRLFNEKVVNAKFSTFSNGVTLTAVFAYYRNGAVSAGGTHKGKKITLVA